MSNKIINDSETKAEGQQVFTAGAFIHQKFDGIEKVFLPKRAKTKKLLPDIFELPGGHIEFGEQMEEGLKREIKEELNMDAEIGDPFFVFTYMNPVKGSHSIEVIYFVEFTSPIDQLRIDPADHSEYKWISEDEIDQIREGKEDDLEIDAIRKGFKILKNL